MNSAMNKGNGNIRACLFFVLFVIAWILILSEYGHYQNPTFEKLCKNNPTLKDCPKRFGGDAL